MNDKGVSPVLTGAACYAHTPAGLNHRPVSAPPANAKIYFNSGTIKLILQLTLVVFPYMLADVGAEASAGFGERLHFFDMVAAGLIFVVQVKRTVLKLHGDAVVTDMISYHAGFVAAFVARHFYGGLHG